MRNVMIGLFAFAVCLLAFVMGAAIRDFSRPAPKAADCCPVVERGCQCCHYCKCVACSCRTMPEPPHHKCCVECKCKVVKKPGAVGDSEKE